MKPFNFYRRHRCTHKLETIESPFKVDENSPKILLSSHQEDYKAYNENELQSIRQNSQKINSELGFYQKTEKSDKSIQQKANTDDFIIRSE